MCASFCHLQTLTVIWTTLQIVQTNTETKAKVPRATFPSRTMILKLPEVSFNNYSASLQDKLFTVSMLIKNHYQARKMAQRVKALAPTGNHSLILTQDPHGERKEQTLMYKLSADLHSMYTHAYTHTLTHTH